MYLLNKFKSIGTLAFVGFLVSTGMAFAAEKPTLDSGDTAWMLTSTVLVLMMTIPGLALFYGGMVRKKNVLATIMQSFAVTCLMTVLWMVIGYSLAFSDGGSANAFVGGLSNMFLSQMKLDTLNGTIPDSVFMTFQMTFAIITPALITGAFADRMKFSSMLVFLGAWMIIVYAPITHWVWGGGFLGGAGVLDFAGGTVVHINAGIAGLVTAIVIGKRRGYRTENMAPHNLVLSVIGAALLWVGWFGFNAGSAVAANATAGMAMAVTQICTAAAALTWMFAEWIYRGKPSVLGIISGAVAGLVCITPAAGFVGPSGALIMGLIAGVGCFWGATFLKQMFNYDDSLDAFGVHGVGGIIGALLTGVFALKEIGGTSGLLEGNAGQVWIQVEGIVATIVYCAIATFIILKFVETIMGLRVDEEAEVEGLDINLHGEIVH
ncbi:MAG: ammonium transporter [Rhodospirillaceae bacterium]|jgi:ammonium transporter, Amt family|nr:ammonium transporter [Rhodospirillales bacterium]MBT3905154.1 ammonium transporter [Rhodospirillaceae bacterium]MBT4702536.1 ammonium transporter [Rhodospirillaceae bacterium]MBT5034855.1 ammonium transporter [Rhodospirillaceae bacterium]MBT6219676.1 ammonium transporter [Rhodospirillaceae bacterium]